MPKVKQVRLKTRAEERMIEECRIELQGIETLLDSSSQRLAHRHDYADQDVKQVTLALKKVRKIQSRYFPITSRSLLRQIDSVDKNGNYKPQLSKQNWKKFKKLRDVKNGKQEVIL